jgi:hypothetical protein
MFKQPENKSGAREYQNLIRDSSVNQRLPLTVVHLFVFVLQYNLGSTVIAYGYQNLNGTTANFAVFYVVLLRFAAINQ